MFKKSYLINVRRRAMCLGIWRSALDDIERGILSLASQIIDSVNSFTLNLQTIAIVARARANDFYVRIDGYSQIYKGKI